ncbi:hypothetical protein [Paraburkholderia strydomiana]|uniref:hypothetical protein n=1 Tax=Paraburkholderia strydomiana TaxID=1245417 RepID=UPI0038B92ED3
MSHSSVSRQNFTDCHARARSIEKATRNLLNRGGARRPRRTLQTHISCKTKRYRHFAALRRVLLRCSKMRTLYLRN